MPRRHAEVAEELPDRPVPRAPAHLGPDGRRAWKVVMAHGPMLLPKLDVVTVERFCRLVDERAAIAAELARGVLLEEVIPDPRGGIAGTRVVLNPAVAALRQADKALDAMVDRLALVPAARARLGLVLTTAERQAADAAAVMADMFAKED